jgi:hypothetical protein
MSGAQIGGVIGGIIGFVWGGGNWQLGYAIGSAIGGAIDPERIAGPKVGDIARQTAQEGVPCPLFAGTAGAAGNLIYKSEVRRVTVDEQQGKGGGPVVETERLYVTFAIRIGASLFYGPGSRTGLVGLSRIWEDEKLVYDVTPTSQMMAESAKYAQGFTFYPGNDTQLPDPDLEAIEGVGNVPAYVGRAYVVFKNKDVTDRLGAVPQYRFEVSAAGSQAAVETVAMTDYDNGAEGGGVEVNWIRVNQAYVDLRAFNAIVAGLGTGTDQPVYIRVLAPEAAGGAVLWDSGWIGDPADQSALTAALSTVTNIRFSDPAGGIGFTDVTDPAEIGVFRTNLNGAIQSLADVTGYFWPPYGIGENAIVQVIRPWNAGMDTVSGEWVLSEPDPAEVTEPYIALPEVPGAILGLTTGTTWFTPYADGVGVITAGTAAADDVVAAIGKICKMDAAVFDTAQIAAKTVRGLVIASQEYTGADAINSLCWVLRADAYDADGQLHFVVRGGAVKATITDDDLVDDDDDQEQEEEIRSGEERRAAMGEMPLKVTLFFPNPTTGYTLTPAASPNYGDRPDAVTEVSMEVPIVLEDTAEAPRLADILEKVADSDAQGEIVRVLPEEFAYLTGTDCITLTERGISRRYRIEKAREGEGRIRLQMRYDRVSNETSFATQAATPAPAQPPSSLAGPTILKVMNSPGIVDGDDRIGVRIALGAVLDGWNGATVQYSADDGETWTTVGYYTTRAVMGTLAAALPYASPLVSDYVNRITVQLFDGRDLESVTAYQLLQEGNGAAIIKPDGQVELLQYETVTDLGSNLWELGNRLLRGRLGTDPIAHEVGAYFVTLASTIFIELPSSLIGRDLLFRAPSFGASPESAEQVAFTWDPMVGQRELQQARLRVTRDGSTVAGTWIPRHRFGTPLAPIAASRFTGWRVTLDDGAETVINVPAGATPEFSVADTFGASVDVTVTAVNSITGEGPALTETGVT